MHRITSILGICAILVTFAASVQSPSAQASQIGPMMLSDFRNGTESSNPSYLFPFNEQILYIRDFIPDSGLWITDGTSLGTQFLKENVSTFNINGQNLSPFHLAKDGVAYFTASDPATGSELWKTDGTPEGTAMVADLAIGSKSSTPDVLVEVGGQLFFIAQTGSGNLPRRLFRTDGSALGTVKLSDLELRKEGLGVLQDRVYFIGEEGTKTISLWRTTADGNGVELVKDITTNYYIQNTDPYFYSWNGRLYFSMDCNSSDYCLWSTDGSTEGTQIVSNFGSSFALTQYLTSAGSWLYFVGYVDGTCPIWRSDGTTAGTTVANDLSTANGTCPIKLFPVGPDLYFIAGNIDVGEDLWRLDGTSGAINLIAHINHEFFPFYEDGLVVKDGWLYFTVNKSDWEAELWRTQGLPANTSLVKSFGNPAEGYPIHDLTLWQDHLLFSVPDTAHGQELWTSDGSLAGTQLLIDLETTPAGSNFLGGIFYRGNLYFNLNDTSAIGTLWRSDGTPQGTEELAKLDAIGLSPLSSSWPKNGRFPYSPPVELAGKMYFLARDDPYTFQLWRTDGTPAGTQMVKGITSEPNNTGGDGLSIASDGSNIYFALWDIPEQKWKTWRSDGTADGTVKIQNSTGDDMISSFVTINGKVIFAYASYDGYGSTTFERTTADGNLEVFAQLPTNMFADYTRFNTFIFFDGYIYFGSDPDASGAPLYRTDGETIQEILPDGLGGTFNRIEDFAVLGNRLFFSGTSGSTTGLWSLSAGSITPDLVKNLTALPTSIVSLTDRLIFHLPGGANGDELWVSDGSTDGTTPLCPECDFTVGDIAVSLLGKMYFSASDTRSR